MYGELLVGFLFVLIFSDSRQVTFAFADNIKNVYAVFLGLFMVMDAPRFRPMDNLIKLFLPFLIIAYLSVMFSPIMLTSLQKTFSFTLLLIIVPNYVIVALKKEGWVFLHMLLWSLIAFLFAGLVLKYISLNFVTLSGRYSGLMGNPNSIGLFSITTLVFITILSEFNPKILSRRELIIAYAIIIASLIFSGSRNAMFAGLIFLMFRVFYKLSPAIGFFIFIVMVVVYQYVQANFASIVIALGIEQFFRLETLNSGSGRFVAWEFGLEWIDKSPVIGGGWGFTEDLYTKYKEILSIRGHQGNAHNSYITFWLDTGFIGLVLYLFGFLRAFFRSAKYTRSAIPLMYAVLFHAFFESWLTGSLNPFTIQLVILLTLMTYIPQIEAADKEKEAEEEGEVLSSEEDPRQSSARPAF